MSELTRSLFGLFHSSTTNSSVIILTSINTPECPEHTSMQKYKQNFGKACVVNDPLGLCWDLYTYILYITPWFLVSIKVFKNVDNPTRK